MADTPGIHAGENALPYVRDNLIDRVRNSNAEGAAAERIQHQVEISYGADAVPEFIGIEKHAQLQPPLSQSTFGTGPKGIDNLGFSKNDVDPLAPRLQRSRSTTRDKTPQVIPFEYQPQAFNANPSPQGGESSRSGSDYSTPAAESCASHTFPQPTTESEAKEATQINITRLLKDQLSDIHGSLEAMILATRPPSVSPQDSQMLDSAVLDWSGCSEISTPLDSLNLSNEQRSSRARYRIPSSPIYQKRPRSEPPSSSGFEVRPVSSRFTQNARHGSCEQHPSTLSVNRTHPTQGINSNKRKTDDATSSFPSGNLGGPILKRRRGSQT